jgi:hypothetical protein
MLRQEHLDFKVTLEQIAGIRGGYCLPANVLAERVLKGYKAAFHAGEVMSEEFIPIKKSRIDIKGRYFKDYGDGETFISGLDLPKDESGVTCNVNFIDCSFHAGTVGKFEDCAINGEPIPDGVWRPFKLDPSNALALAVLERREDARKNTGS